MNELLRPIRPEDVEYPESDGEPMADNTKQLRWIVVLYSNLAALFHLDANVFVGGNQFWFPVQGQPGVRMAPDVYVVFGRPKGDRPSYKQWEEGNVPMTVVFEVLSPGNQPSEMIDKHAFYEEYGVEEYYIGDPDNNRLHIYVRQGEMLRRVRGVEGFVSPRLGIRFDLSGPEMVVFAPSGRPFIAFEELEAERLRLEAANKQLETDRDLAKQRAARLAELSRKTRHQQATQEELQELERLEEQSFQP